MRIEEELFYGYQWNEDKLIPFGFVLQNNKYVKQYPIHHNEFTACIEISKDHINGKIIDNNFDEEYTLFRNDKVIGEFIGSLREKYEAILLDIRKHCFTRLSFPDPQANRIAEYIYQTYQDKADYSWAKYPYYGVYRNKDNNRWYGLVMNVEDNKLGESVKGRWVINIKPPKHMFNELLQIENIYPGWHMNKKSWLSISLSDYFPDEYIESLIDMSYEEVNGLSKVKMFPPKK